MKRFQSFILCLVLTLFCPVGIYSQKDKIPSKNKNQIAVIFPDAFEDDKTGIIDLIEVNQSLRTEIKPQADELNELSERILLLQQKIEDVIPICKLTGCSSLGKMLDEHKELTSEFKLKQKEAFSKYEKRKKEETIVINQKIFEALEQFRKNGKYKLILDGSKLDMNCYNCIDITQEFIKFYNENFSEAKSQ